MKSITQQLVKLYTVNLTAEAAMPCYNHIRMSLAYNNVSSCAINKCTGQLIAYKSQATRSWDFMFPCSFNEQYYPHNITLCIFADRVVIWCCHGQVNPEDGSCWFTWSVVIYLPNCTTACPGSTSVTILLHQSLYGVLFWNLGAAALLPCTAPDDLWLQRCFLHFLQLAARGIFRQVGNNQNLEYCARQRRWKCRGRNSWQEG